MCDTSPREAFSLLSPLGFIALHLRGCDAVSLGSAMSPWGSCSQDGERILLYFGATTMTFLLYFAYVSIIGIFSTSGYFVSTVMNYLGNTMAQCVPVTIQENNTRDY